MADPQTLPPEFSAFYALTRDGDVRDAEEFALNAHLRLERAMSLCRGDDGEILIPPEAMAEISAVRLFLIGLSSAMNPDLRTPVNVKFPKRPGRPKRKLEKIAEYRSAARDFLERKRSGYDAALLEVSTETGLDRREIEGWAAYIEGTLHDAE